MSDEWAWWRSYTPREYEPLQIDQLTTALYDHASDNGHMLQDWKQHPTLPLVRLFRCSGCVVVYRLCLAGPSAAPWDAPSLVTPYGICPSSYSGVLALASGEDGALAYWGEADQTENWQGIVRASCGDGGHGPIRYLSGRKLGQPGELFPDFSTPHLWQCSTCGRLLARLSNPLAERCQLYLSNVCCVGAMAKSGKAR